jgi:GNAT superfamily N-acetyltransferase
VVTVLDVRVHDYADSIVQELVEEVQGEYEARYGDRDRTPVDPADFTPPAGFFMVGWHAGEAVGSVALRAVADRPGTVELKRLYVRESYRRQGLARDLLRSAEDRARAAGYRRVILETGIRQPEALALYPGAGYVSIPDFGHYAGEPESVYFGKDL